MNQCEQKWVTLSGYRFTPLQQLEHWQHLLQEICIQSDLKGTILLAAEGINVNLVGHAQNIAVFIRTLRACEEFAQIEFKQAPVEVPPYRRLWIRIKPEIIAVGRLHQDLPQMHVSRLAPPELKRWYDEGREFYMLDTRNQFEIGFGTFVGAKELQLRTFAQFPLKVVQAGLDPRMPVVTFCTGGIRCEKAAPLMVEFGFTDVYQLEGGILNYFNKCGDAHFHGECFVFDRRISVDAALEATGTRQCEKCEAPVPNQSWQVSDLCPSCQHPYSNKMN